MSFRKFAARRGVPQHIISDNAKQLKLANNVLKTLWESIQSDDSTKNVMAYQRIRWDFIVDLSPWMGGVYERMVQMAKRALQKSIGRKRLHLFEFTTLLAEVETVLNSRPLTYVSDELNASPLTPANLLLINPNLSLPSYDYDVSDPNFALSVSSKQFLLQKLSVSQEAVNRFWKQWREEYFAALRERHDYTLKQTRVLAHDTPSVNSIVLIKEEFLPRNVWSFGRIVTLHESADGKVRAATVKLPSGVDVRRPLCLLHPVECSENETESEIAECPANRNSHNKHPGETGMNRPTRKAATKARQLLKKLVDKDAV